MRSWALAIVLAVGLSICHQLLRAGPLQTGAEQAGKDNHAAAVDLYTQAIQQDPKLAEAYYLRGRSYYCLGRIKESVADFDRYVGLSPRAESQQWERGIALYYAGEYERGAKQFELYQTFHDNDVENSTWRYLCVARSKGVEEAKKTLLPIRDDTRVPMMQIYDLYAGKLKPAEVLAAVEKKAPAGAEREAPLFYAHLYIGLWYEAAGNVEQAKKHLEESEKHKIGHYMWDVARVHNALRKAEAKKP